MRFPKIRTILITPFVLFVFLYAVAAVFVARHDIESHTQIETPDSPLEIAIFGASGTAGDGILKAALAADEIGTIHVITRRETPRMTTGVEAGKIKLTTHMDYLDYSAILQQVKDVDAVFWAIGISAIGADQPTYRKIHTDFPREFLSAWNAVSTRPERSFHFLSSSDISEESSTMWVQEKIHAEKTLFAFGADNELSVIAYRPDYIGPTEEEAHLGQQLLYWFFKPLGVAIKAQEIGQAMIAASLSKEGTKNGAKLSHRKILALSLAYENQR